MQKSEVWGYDPNDIRMSNSLKPIINDESPISDSELKLHDSMVLNLIEHTQTLISSTQHRYFDKDIEFRKTWSIWDEL